MNNALENVGSTAPQLPARLPSNVPGLDTVLNGGMFQGSLYLIMGEPGTGKTILGNQICFNHVAEGGRALYVTLLTKSHTRLLTSLQTLNFFKPDAVGETLLYFSGYSVLTQEGIEGLYAMLRQVVRTHHASLLVLDGLAMITLEAAGELAYKTFLQRLQTLSELQQCITVLISHQSTREASAEQVIADALIELTNHHIGLRVVRQLEVWKLRGSAYIEGRHYCAITSAGMTIYPRTEALLAEVGNDPPSNNRAHFGVPELDQMVGDGLSAGTATMLVGVTGSGKTVLGLHFLTAGLAANEPGLYFGFNEPPPQLRNNAARLGLDLDSQVARELITLEWHPPGDNIPDALVAQMLSIIEQKGVRRLFIDGLGGLTKTLVDPERQYGIFKTLANELRRRGVTSVFSLEMVEATGSSAVVPQSNIAETADNIVHLRYSSSHERMRRVLSIVKVRNGSYDSRMREFDITSQGFRLAEPAGPADAPSPEASQASNPGTVW